MKEISKKGEQFEGSPTVSVIITAYNAAPFIHEALDSVLNQTFKNFEIIVVNDGSPDTTELEAALTPYLDRISYIRQRNKGTGAARNTGICASRGRFICLLDGDDIWESQYLEVQLEILEREPDAVMVYPNAIHFGVGDTVGQMYMDVCPSEGEATFDSLLSERCTVMVSVAIRREAIVSAGMFDEDRALMGADDFDLWLRIAKQGGRIVYHRRPLVRRRFWKGQLSSQLVRFHSSTLHVLEKVEQNMDLTDAQLKILQERQLHYRAMLNLIRGKEELLQSNTKAAYEYLMEANLVLRRPKVSFVLFLLRIAPGVFGIWGVRKFLLARNQLK